MNAHPALFRPPCRISPLCPQIFHSVSVICHLHTMIPMQTQCQGCDRVFTPRGLSQHASKTQNVRCHAINNLLQYEFGIPSILRAASPSAPSPNHITAAISDSQHGNEYHPTGDQVFNKVPELDDDSSSGASFASHVPNQGEGTFSHLLRSDPFFTVYKTEGLVQPSIQAPDPADVADANAFEELTRSINQPSTMVIDHPADNSLADVPEELGPQTNQSEAGSFNTGSTVVVDRFPSDAAGAPIPGIPRGRSLYETCRAGLSGSEWAPFQSQHDWEFARWAKSTGVTSTAVSNLLTIPEVRSIFIR